MMSLTIPVSFGFYTSYFYRAFYFYTCCRQTKQICSTMSLTKLGMSLGLLLSTILEISISVLKSLLLVFWVLSFLHQQGSSSNVFDSLHSFGAQTPDFPSKFQNQFYSYSLTLISQHIQPLYFLQKHYPSRSNERHL